MIPPRRGRYLFHKGPQLHAGAVLAVLLVVMSVMLVARGFVSGAIPSPFQPTVAPTRTVNSYAQEGQVHFESGDLTKAIAAYQQAVKLEPNNPGLWSELARIQAYSSQQLTTDAEQQQRMKEALNAADKAVALAPEDSSVHAVRAFVLDWNANPVWAGAQRDALLADAEQEASRALVFDNTNGLAMAYYAEILADELKVAQAQDYISRALQADGQSMDVHRINAYILEMQGQYQQAIAEYQRAAQFAPNLTFLYISIGTNYRQLALKAATKQEQSNLYDQALSYFSKAAAINDGLGIKDPIPYIAIAKTYSQMGQFMVASRNIEKAVAYNPYTPDVYGQMGVVYLHNRNYEGAILALQCAVIGCDPQQSCTARNCQDANNPAITIQGLPLSSNTVVYYYTYGSVLAAMHSPGSGYCDEAMKVLEQVRGAFSNDTTIMPIVDESEQICISYGYSR